MDDAHERELVKIYIDLPGHWAAVSGESVWGREVGEGLYEVDNIPFYAYGVNYRDVVRTVTDDPSLKPRAVSVARRSGYRTHRIFMPDQPRDRQRELLDQLRPYGVDVERCDDALIAISVAPDADEEELYRVLDRLEEQELLEYETCEAGGEDRPGLFDEFAGPGVRPS